MWIYCGEFGFQHRPPAQSSVALLRVRRRCFWLCFMDSETTQRFCYRTAAVLISRTMSRILR